MYSCIDSTSGCCPSRFDNSVEPHLPGFMIRAPGGPP